MANGIKTSREEKSWILYDVGNSAFVLIIITSIMPIFFKEVASQGVDTVVSTSNWAFANSIASLLLALSAPILGTFADYKGFKKKFFLFFLFLGLCATFLLTTVTEGAWLLCLLIFVFARVGFAGANIFYDAFLPDITQPEKMDRVSTNGFAWGYIGSVIPFLLVMTIIYLGMKSSGLSTMPPLHAKIGFAVVGIWWLLFSVPFIKNVHQTHYVTPSQKPIHDSIVRFITTFKEIRKYKQAFLFLVAYFFYIDGINTIVTMATAYGIDIGLHTTMLILAILMIQIVSFPFALLYGKLAEKFNAKAMLLVGISVYTVITSIAFFIPALPTIEIKMTAFWILAFLVATSMGGVQALSRSYFGKLIPADRSGEFFGFYNIFGKFAAITGPLLMGAIGRATGESKYGVLSIALLLVVGAIVLIHVKPTIDDAIA